MSVDATDAGPSRGEHVALHRDAFPSASREAWQAAVDKVLKGADYECRLVSSLAAGHLTLVPELKAALAEAGREDIMIVVGGVIPPGDYEALRQAGAAAIFPPGTVIVDAAEALVADLSQRLGYGARITSSPAPDIQPSEQG